MPTVTERTILDALHARYSQRSQAGNRYVCAEHVRCGAGFDARRTADLLVLDTWLSSGLRIIGHEVKVSRGDWLRELADPSKAAAFTSVLDEWWIVAPLGVVRPEELPPTWGLITLGATGRGLRAAHPATDLNPSRDRFFLANEASWRLPAGMTAALIRATRRTYERHTP